MSRGYSRFSAEKIFPAACNLSAPSGVLSVKGLSGKHKGSVDRKGGALMKLPEQYRIAIRLFYV